MTTVLDGHAVVPWRFTAASPGTLDLEVPVLAPVQFDRDAVSGAQLLFLLCPGVGGKPIQSTREVTRFVSARHRWLVPEQSGGTSADAFIDQIADARANVAIPYFTYQALTRPAALGGSGVGTAWKMLFDLAQPLVIEYLGGHRYLGVCLFQAVA